MSKNLSELSGRKGLMDNLFARLGDTAVEEGAPSTEALESLAQEFLIGTANTYGTASFYDFTREENRGKKVYVCNGSACLCAGTQDAVHHELEKQFKPEEIGHMTCLGRCHENGAFFYQGNNYSAKTPAEIATILSGAKAPMDDYSVRSTGTAVLTGPVVDAKAHVTRLLGQSPDQWIKEIELSRLRGRGGAGFPISMKLDFCRKAPGTEKFVICNADEGDPGAYSDRYLLEKQGTAVLMGLLTAGYVTGANWGVMYIRAEYPEAVRMTEALVSSLNEQGLLGQDIQGSGFSFQVKVIHAQGSYICGEETALINSIEGQRPEVRVRPPYPAIQGLFNKPTVVNNVETLAALPWILENGGSEYAALGTEKSSGTKLVSLDGLFNRPGMLEVEMGTSLKDVVYELGGGFREPVKGLHIGGPLGGIVPVSKIGDLNVDFESFAGGGFLLGHASVVSIPERMPMVKYLTHLFEFAAYESCGKCFPCRLGTQRAAEMLQKAQSGTYKIDKTLFDDLLHTLQTASLCAHGGGIPLPVRNSLMYFKEELEQYFA